MVSDLELLEMTPPPPPPPCPDRGTPSPMIILGDVVVLGINKAVWCRSSVVQVSGGVLTVLGLGF